MNAMTIYELAEETGLSQRGIERRIYRNGIRPTGRVLVDSRWQNAYAPTPDLIAPHGKRRSEYAAEDADWMASQGMTVDEAVRRLGYASWDSLYKALNRQGRNDIAARLRRNTTKEEA